ncbi:phage tail protein [Oryzibacter oryziterrae]|uniref:phage tail protein n=1 Tax=Oryzibacter oryziterrae TaxID=2766474 RepID=UPI0028BE2B67|nr:phage tail protein [Oryzibacter oryziterrae]
MSRMIMAALLAASTALPSTAYASETPHLGEVATFAFNYCPQGWAPTNGMLLSIQQNQALFSLLGTKFGGNGVNSFALPKYSVISAPTNSAPGQLMTVCIALQGIYPAQQ